MNSILLVDDSKVSLKYMIDILNKEYIIYLAHNGKEAIEVAKEQKPDLILLDLIMPDISGHEVIEILKQNNDTKKIPVIFLTGVQDIENHLKALQNKAADYIIKNSNPDIILLRIKNQITIVNQIRNIEKLSKIDFLTELNNRQSFYELSVRLWNFAKKRGEPIGLIFIDIDNFKSYNDSVSHSYGDYVLKLIAQIISKEADEYKQFIARWGGEEFAILLPGNNLEETLELSEKIRHSIEKETKNKLKGTNKTATVSIGAGSIVPTRKDTFEEFFKKVDNMLLMAKTGGKNKVVCMRS